MQYVKDDMDEQFRRAAENYPLDTSGADWSKVQKGLESPVEVSVPRQTNKNRRLLWLLLLLPLTFICNRYYELGEGNSELSGKNTGKINTGSGITTGSSKPAPDQPGTSLPVGPNAVNQTGLSSDNLPENSSPVISGQSKNDISVPGEKLKTNAGKTVQRKFYSTLMRSSAKAGKNGAGKFPSSSEDDYLYNGKNEETRLRAVSSASFFTSSLPYPEREPVILSPLAAKKNEIFRPVLQGQLIDPADARFKRFYAGIMGGVDATTIKFQEKDHLGYDYGLILGYDLNRRFAVEAGLFMDKKFYYTDGKYFNTSKVYLPPNSKITEVSGDCRMWEIPVSLRYNFPSARRSSLYAAAGITSYIMKKEQYDYMYYYGNTNTYASHYKSYNNSSTNLFSAIHLSGGFTKPLGKIADLRIEPYIKIPISKMGYGDLPLLSTGIQIGVTKKLF